jgi:SpoVK/Ycf46/Vps4 family AAA+-type ATPase
VSKNPKINININKDDSELNDFLHCWGQFGTRPNKIIIYNSFSKDEFISILSEYSEEKNVFTEIIPAEESSIINDKVLTKVSEDLYISYLLLDRNNENSIIHEITFFSRDYEKELENINDILEKLNPCIIDFQDDIKETKLNTIVVGQSGLEIEPLELKEMDSELDMYYNTLSLKKVNKLIKTIKKSEKGLSIFYGPRGSGKTSIINHVSSKLDRVVMFIPNNLIESTINNPEFKRFLLKHPKPVIVLDDCEVIFNDMYYKSNTVVNNLLQMIDGFLSDSIELNVITIFNTDEEEEIDQSLLDCNNLLDVIEFNLLDIEESNELAKHLGSRKKYKNKVRLIDIIKKKDCLVNKKVGF